MRAKKSKIWQGSVKVYQTVNSVYNSFHSGFSRKLLNIVCYCLISGGNGQNEPEIWTNLLENQHIS